MPTGDGETLAVETPPSPVVPPPAATPPATTAGSSSPASTTQRRHRRHRTFSSSSSSSSSLSTVSSAASSPLPSPRGRGTTNTTTTTTTSVPFSWEYHPGIPKTSLITAGGGTPSSSTPTPLPLPPPLRAPTPTTSSRPRHHHHHARRWRASGKPRLADDAPADPFAAALTECTRERGGAGAGSDDAGLMDALFPARAAPPASTTSRRWSSIASAGAVVGLLDLYGCKSAMVGVAEGAFVVRRPVAVVRRAVPAGSAGLGLGRAGRR